MSEKHSRSTELMHAVLDGEASDGETRELQALLAGDPALRAEFDEWKRLFQAFDTLPKEHAPEGLLAAVTAALPAAPSRGAATASQPFPGPRVFGRTLSGFFRPGREHFRAMKPPGFASATPPRSVTMSEQSSRRISTQRKAWLGAGIAAAAVVAVAQFGFDFPLTKDVVGTVIPAQRYRAAQNGSEDVKLGAPGAATAGAQAGVAADASRSAAEKTAERSETQKTVDMAVQRSETQKTADLTAQRSETQKTADLAVQRSESQKTADLTARRSEAQKTADLAARRSQMQKTAEMTAQRSEAQKSADLAARRSEADKTADRSTVDRTADRSTAEMTAQRAESARLESQRTLEKSTNRSTQP